ncbi:hypothetical protein HYC85_025480 [Camellia sinensis]|uniref:Uncharacterized protein n=1 Tax=Camellia sinensis TaxID=4442 RepID=A0A7J7GEY8_CAMSI|nr:hypothetical protein HYC85_025480 [Camellia sinensis]
MANQDRGHRDGRVRAYALTLGEETKMNPSTNTSTTSSFHRRSDNLQQQRRRRREHMARNLIVVVVVCHLRLLSTITFGNSIYSANGNPWRSIGRANVRQNRAEFLRRSGMVASRGTLWNNPRRSSGWSDSPVKGMISLTTGRVTRNRQDYYSTFHRTPNRKKFSKKEWENITQESTRHAVAELASSPKFTDWIIKHADRIRLLPDDNTIGSGSDSTKENLVYINTSDYVIKQLWQCLLFLCLFLPNTFDGCIKRALSSVLTLNSVLTPLIQSPKKRATHLCSFNHQFAYKFRKSSHKTIDQVEHTYKNQIIKMGPKMGPFCPTTVAATRAAQQHSQFHWSYDRMRSLLGICKIVFSKPSLFFFGKHEISLETLSHIGKRAKHEALNKEYSFEYGIPLQDYMKFSISTSKFSILKIHSVQQLSSHNKTFFMQLTTILKINPSFSHVKEMITFHEFSSNKINNFLNPKLHFRNTWRSSQKSTKTCINIHITQRKPYLKVLMMKRRWNPSF